MNILNYLYLNLILKILQFKICKVNKLIQKVQQIKVKHHMHHYGNKIKRQIVVIIVEKNLLCFSENIIVEYVDVLYVMIVAKVDKQQNIQIKVNLKEYVMHV